ncbi:hypothetical protein B484DRAFT_447188 [Ochromonadaceae sp. CCMP2298]|nr:hypothetical protein B484DRAFT_447188 [Ochromonadaceae sp. CCMP2298]|mmetsp:Transcript_5430/g.11880  ORF Transcript_5430/g.11880 Transcript_5430/m.11880 type:complete len:205 (+) Transcript_5430:186-800(+)
MYLAISLYVDGHDVGYNKVVKRISAAKYTFTFRGFREKDLDLRAFKFAEPSVSDQQSAGDAGSSMGTIRVHVKRRQHTGTKAAKLSCYEAPQSKELKEGKKFWQQPSLATEAGRHLPNGLTNFSTKQHKTLEKLPSLELHYHSTAMADFLDGIYASAVEDAGEGEGENGGTARKRRRTGLSGGTLTEPIDLVGVEAEEGSSSSD